MRTSTLGDSVVANGARPVSTGAALVVAGACGAGGAGRVVAGFVAGAADTGDERIVSFNQYTAPVPAPITTNNTTAIAAAPFNVPIRATNAELAL